MPTKKAENQTKEDKINAEIRRLNKMFKDVPENKKKIAENVVKRAAFLFISIQDLEDYINENGYVEEYQNGENQSGLKESSYVKTLINFTRNYLAVIKQLNELLPDELPKIQSGLKEFAAAGKRR